MISNNFTVTLRNPRALLAKWGCRIRKNANLDSNSVGPLRRRELRPLFTGLFPSLPFDPLPESPPQDFRSGDLAGLSIQEAAKKLETAQRERDRGNIRRYLADSAAGAVSFAALLDHAGQEIPSCLPVTAETLKLLVERTDYDDIFEQLDDTDFLTVWQHSSQMEKNRLIELLPETEQPKLFARLPLAEQTLLIDNLINHYAKKRAKTLFVCSPGTRQIELYLAVGAAARKEVTNFLDQEQLAFMLFALPAENRAKFCAAVDIDRRVQLLGALAQSDIERLMGALPWPSLSGLLGGKITNFLEALNDQGMAVLKDKLTVGEKEQLFKRLPKQIKLLFALASDDEKLAWFREHSFAGQRALVKPGNEDQLVDLAANLPVTEFIAWLSLLDAGQQAFLVRTAAVKDWGVFYDPSEGGETFRRLFIKALDPEVVARLLFNI